MAALRFDGLVWPGPRDRGVVAMNASGATPSLDTIKRLRRWANARDKRLAAGGHAGVTGTALLREAADRIEELTAILEALDGAVIERWER